MFSARCRVRLAGGGEVEFQTTAIPATVRRAGVGFQRSIGAGGRRAYRDGVAHANRSVRRLIGLIDGMVSVACTPGRARQWPPRRRCGFHRARSPDRAGARAADERAARARHLGEAALRDPCARGGWASDAARRRVPLLPAPAVADPDLPCAARDDRFADRFAESAGSPRAGAHAGSSVPAPHNLRGWGRVLLSGLHLRPGGSSLATTRSSARPSASSPR